MLQHCSGAMEKNAYPLIPYQEMLIRSTMKPYAEFLHVYLEFTNSQMAIFHLREESYGKEKLLCA